MDDNFAARGTLHRPFRKHAGRPTRGEAGREHEAQGRAGTFGDKDAAVDEGGNDATSLTFACGHNVCSVGPSEFAAVKDRFE